MKKFTKYLTITILLLIGLCAVGVLYIFFIPNSSLFGICYISYNQDYYSESYSTDNISKVVLKSNDYDVKIVPSTSDKISVKVYANSLGFLLKKNKWVSITPLVADNTLTFTIAEPTGAVVRNRSYVELRLPADMNISLDVINNNATATLTSENLTINNLHYSANHGNFTLSNSTITGRLDLDLNNSILKLDSSVVTSNNEVLLKMAGGKFDASEAVLGNITINKNDKGIVIAKECTRLDEKTNRAGGRIEIKKVGNIDLESSDTNVYIDELLYDGYIAMSASGNVNLGTCHATTTINAANGNVSVKVAESPMQLKTTNGNILVESAFRYVRAQSTYGNIEVTYADEAEHHADTGTVNRYFSANTENGKIVVKGAEYVNIVITKNGRAEVEMDDVVGSNSITAGNGSVNVLVSDNAKFMLSTESETGSVNVNYLNIPGGVAYTNIKYKEYQIPASNDTENTLAVKSDAGSIRIRDVQTQNAGF